MHFLDLILHLDKYLHHVVDVYHNYFYLILFLVIFCETGLVVTPFLPGDSLLFITGGLAADGGVYFSVVAAVVIAAAFLGDNTNFLIGRFLGYELFKNPKSKIFRRDILDRTHEFYEKYGRVTVVIARFVPLMRTFVPFVAGIGKMSYIQYIVFSFLGSVLWVTILLGGGFLFGNIPLVKDHLSIFMLIVVLISVLPILKIIISNRKKIFSK